MSPQLTHAKVDGLVDSPSSDFTACDVASSSRKTPCGNLDLVACRNSFASFVEDGFCAFLSVEMGGG